MGENGNQLVSHGVKMPTTLRVNVRLSEHEVETLDIAARRWPHQKRNNSELIRQILEQWRNERDSNGKSASLRRIEAELAAQRAELAQIGAQLCAIVETLRDALRVKKVK
jgi:hypothetical protein